MWLNTNAVLHVSGSHCRVVTNVWQHVAKLVQQLAKRSLIVQCLLAALNMWYEWLAQQNYQPHAPLHAVLSCPAVTSAVTRVVHALQLLLTRRMVLPAIVTHLVCSHAHVLISADISAMSNMHATHGARRASVSVRRVASTVDAKIFAQCHARPVLSRAAYDVLILFVHAVALNHVNGRNATYHV
jgi:hypothetical protein